MSTKPGDTLEEFVTWNYNIVVDDLRECNFSLGGAELLKTIPLRPRISAEHLKRILAHWEPYREEVERKLDDYDDTDEGDGPTSWRSYAGYSFDFVPNEVWEAGISELRTILKEIEFGGAVGGGKTGMVAGLTDENSDSGEPHDHKPGYN